MNLNRIIVLACLLLSVPTFAGKIRPFDYSNIDNLASNIVIATVSSTTENKPEGACSSKYYEATMSVVSSIKGSISGNVFTLPVCIGHKGFNSELNQGKTYIFFLKEQNGKHQRVHPLTVAPL